MKRSKLPMGINFNVDVIKFYEHILGHMNKDKNYICMGLSYIRENVQDWYNTINDIFAPEIRKCYHGEELTINKKVSGAGHLESMLTAHIYTPKAVQAQKFLDMIIKRYENGELRKLVNQLDIKNVRELTELIGGEIDENDKQIKPVGFVGIALEKKIFSFQTFISGIKDEKKAREIEEWLERLKKKKVEIENTISSLQDYDHLQCNEDIMKNLYSQNHKHFEVVKMQDTD